MRTAQHNDQEAMDMSPMAVSPSEHEQGKIALSSSADSPIDAKDPDDDAGVATPMVVPAAAIDNNTSSMEHHDERYSIASSSKSSGSSCEFDNDSNNPVSTASPASPPSFSTNGSSSELTMWNGSGSNVAAKPKGVCGLNNLGNTCFMNSALQCLSNTPQLSKYFLAGKYKEELNRDNPLGMKGHVAEAYGTLIETLWNGKLSSTAPREFKHTIGQFNPSFNGYMQHDSQELLAFLLDGLHEDLNRIFSKPYRELPDFDNMSDHEIAQESWSYHKARNDSVIVDLFQGQFKSRLTCNTCKKVSVTFDPFMYLSLPLPIQKKTRLKITYVPYSPMECAQRMTLVLPKDASIEQLKKEVAKKIHTKHTATLLVAEIFSGKFYKIFESNDIVSTIGHDDDIYVYQTPGPVPKPRSKRFGGGGGYTLRDGKLSSNASEQQPENKLIVFPVYCQAVSEDGTRKSFGGPVLVGVFRAIATDAERVYRLITHQMERYANVKLLEPAKVEGDKATASSPGAANGGDASEQQQQQPVHTAAAVKHASNVRLEPMPNLFKMKVIPEERSYGGDTNIFPAGTTRWYGVDKFADLRERAADEKQLREEIESGRSAVATGKDGSESDSKDTDDELVDDVRASWEKRDSSRAGKGMVQTATSSGSRFGRRKSEQQLPPKEVIRQGEGIVLEWPMKKAEQMFGSDTIHGMGSDSGWRNIDVLHDDTPDDDDHSAKKEKKDVTLADCLSEFTKEELLSEEDLWYCPSCKKHQRASKKFDLWRLPEVLVVHLKRFSHTRAWRDKIDAFIDFPLKELDLTDRVLSVEHPDQVPPHERYIYDLYGVDNHYGGMGGGHYTAYAQNWADGKWYNFDDSHVSEVDAGSAKTSAAYLLFYRRRRQETHVNGNGSTVADASKN